jgi:hypothetical protein
VIRNRICHTLSLALVLAGGLAVVGASPAVALPKGEYAVFEQCPLGNEEISGCLVSRTESGEVTIGNQEVPIVNTQTLQGGVKNIATEVKELVAAANGETLTKTPQKVPGGLADLIKCNEIKGLGLAEVLERATCEVIFENGVTGVNATTELAAPASSVILNLKNAELESETTLTLPIKVKLENPLLGAECYIGSNSNPMTLHLSTGKSGSLTGKLGEISTKAEGGILVVKNSRLVDNTFTAPGVTGCGGLVSFLLDPIINAKLGLPASSGTNSAVLNTTLELASNGLVLESEE